MDIYENVRRSNTANKHHKNVTKYVSYCSPMDKKFLTIKNETMRDVFYGVSCDIYSNVLTSLYTLAVHRRPRSYWNASNI